MMVVLRAMVTTVAFFAAATCHAVDARPNVLFIAVDDLRPALGCYADPAAKTPNIDLLAERGVVLERAYCQVPSCCPSRTAVLTGLRPASTGVDSNRSAHFRSKLPHCVTLPEYFKQHGYFCKELGKVFHRRDPVSWSEPKWIPQAAYAYPIYGTDAAIARQKKARVTTKPEDWWGHSRWIKADSWEAPQVSGEELFDGQLATKAIAELRRPHEKPWLLALGFFRPHLPFIAPQKYYDFFPEGKLALPLETGVPEGAPECSAHRSPEARSYPDIKRSGAISAAKQRELLRGYYAAVSYVDVQIGRVLAELEKSGQDEKTIVVLWSDHGYQLGEQGIWGKATNYEMSLRSTLIVAAPGIAAGRTDGLVELLDLYPTLCELSSLPAPSGLAGKSFAPLLHAPEGAGKQAVYSQASPQQATGYSVRTDGYRYTQWQRDGVTVARELYNLHDDRQETKNLVATADDKLLRELQSLLLEGHPQLKTRDNK